VVAHIVNHFLVKTCLTFARLKETVALGLSCHGLSSVWHGLKKKSSIPLILIQQEWSRQLPENVDEFNSIEIRSQLWKSNNWNR